MSKISASTDGNAAKYDELDAAIIARIRAGHSRFYEIWPALEGLAKPHLLPYRGADRLVDRRLQALRKQRRITYYGSRWSVL